MKPKEERTLFCRRCRVDTCHSVEALGQDSARDRDDDDDSFYWESHLFVKCRGCASYGYVIETQWYEYEGTERLACLETKLYPRSSGWRDAPHWRHELPTRLGTAYDEALAAVNAGLNTLAAIGIRLLVEEMCKNLGATKGNLQKKIQALHTTAPITEEQTKPLEKHRLFGNAAAHKGYSPTREELHALLEIIERLLAVVYSGAPERRLSRWGKE